MESGDVFSCDLLKRLNLKAISQGLFDGDLILARELHQEDVHDIEDNKDKSLPEFDPVSEEEDRDDDQVEQDEDGLTSDNPPIDKSLCWYDQIEDTLHNEGIEGCLLHDSRDTDIRDAEEDRIHNDKGLGCRVSHSEKCGIHRFR